MKLMSQELRKQFEPYPLYSQENASDPFVVCKFFNPSGSGTWYMTEFDGEDLFFGFCTGLQEDEFGYMSLSEMQAVRGPHGLGIERDIHFIPRRLSECRAAESSMVKSMMA